MAEPDTGTPSLSHLMVLMGPSCDVHVRKKLTNWSEVEETANFIGSN